MPQFRDSKHDLEKIRDRHLRAAMEAEREGDWRSAAEHHRVAGQAQTALGGWFTEKAEHEVALQHSRESARTIHQSERL